MRSDAPRWGYERSQLRRGTTTGTTSWLAAAVRVGSLERTAEPAIAETRDGAVREGRLAESG